MQAEQVLKFGCDTKYAAWTFGGIGVRTYGPVCFVFDINKLPPELLETATAFIGDSGRKSVVNGVACLPSDILSDFIDFQSLATEASCRFYLDYQTAGSQLSTVHIQSLRDRYSNTDAMLEVHLHGKLPLSALCSIRVCKTEYDKAKRMEETAEELYSSPDQELNRVLYKSYMNSYKSIRKIIDRKYTGNIKLVLA
ncbi:hypothetical protein COB72_05610 [bacterium]|nr:MAG: hypothetical protein COB72_05610 [bacterium]